MEEKNALNDQELENIVGGRHISSAELKALTPGNILVWKKLFGKPLAEVEFISYEDPGLFAIPKCTVKVLTIYSSNKYIEVFNNNGAGQTVASEIHEGDVCTISRDLLSFPEEA